MDVLQYNASLIWINANWIAFDTLSLEEQGGGGSRALHHLTSWEQWVVGLHEYIASLLGSGEPWAVDLL